MTVVLPAVPSLGGLYARGAGATGRLAVARRLGRAPNDLPDVVHAVSGVRADADRLTAYQHLVGESASDLLPAGFVHVLAFPVAFAVMVRPDFPLPLLGLVHVANRVEQHAPLALADSFDVRAWAEGLRPHRSGTTVDLVAEARLDGALVWRGVSTYLAKGVQLAGRADPQAPAPFVPPTPTGRWRLAADTGRRYAAVSGDHNPIHLSALSAKALGFPRAIAHGMYTAARALADVGAARGDAFTWDVEFHKPVLLPGTVTVRVAPTGTAGPGASGQPSGHSGGSPSRATGGPSGTTFAGWDPRTGKPHLTGSVVPTR